MELKLCLILVRYSILFRTISKFGSLPFKISSLLSKISSLPSAKIGSLSCSQHSRLVVNCLFPSQRASYTWPYTHTVVGQKSHISAFFHNFLVVFCNFLERPHERKHESKNQHHREKRYIFDMKDWLPSFQKSGFFFFEKSLLRVSSGYFRRWENLRPKARGRSLTHFPIPRCRRHCRAQ